ncbi:alpha/beta hydrolase family esterase [Ampullimonas aquatilis]|uniref:extracellular catalytic domain type 1 short-chain-length polyhydroxyalkanoate depolymerase n=1 Tax=Ampullimonas aquatilis TaxID=1341549 RepID=UPI003C75E898
MVRRKKSIWSRSLQRSLNALTRSAINVGSKAVKQALRSTPVVKKIASSNSAALAAGKMSMGIAVGATGGRRYWLYQPAALQHDESLPLLVMLHGCGQDAKELAACSRMNRLAARERFIVLYVEQDRLANMQGCWNWYETRSGLAQAEAAIIDKAIDQVCLLHAVDATRIAVAGLSAGASMAALLATRHPERFRAVVMHSGVAPGMAHSSVTALRAMRGREKVITPLDPFPPGTRLPALLVIQGSADGVVAPSNGAIAARRWAALCGTTAVTSRVLQRGARYPATITDYRVGKQLVATQYQISGLGHAWSGGAKGRAYSDPHGPDASRIIWAFVSRQFASVGE